MVFSEKKKKNGNKSMIGNNKFLLETGQKQDGQVYLLLLFSIFPQVTRYCKALEIANTK